MKQITFVGADVDFETLPVSVKKGRKKTKTMQEMFGVLEGKRCKTCKHCYRCQMANVWYKCELWDNCFDGSSAASDIRLKWQACKKYEEVLKNDD